MICPPILVTLLSFLQMTWCSRDPNQAAFSPLFLPPGSGRGNGTKQSTPTNASLLRTSLPFLRGRHRAPNSPGHRHPRPGSSPPHELHRVSALQKGCEYSKAIYGPKILLQLEYAMEACAPTLRVDITQLERVQRLAIRKMRGLRRVPYEESQ